MTDRSPLPDDVGAYCADIPDAISLRDLARERAREAQSRLTADEAMAELVASFWQGEFDALRPSGAAFTLQRPAAQSREELDADSWPPDTLARRAVYWTAPEYAAFVARFWYLEAEHPLPELSSDEERLRWLAALPLSQYPPAVLTLLERLHVSRATLEPPTEPRRKVARQAETPKLGAPRQQTIEAEALVRNRIEAVLAEAKSRWPNKRKRPDLTPMAKELHRLGKAQDYSIDTLRKILSGRYGPAKKLGISLDW